MLSNNNTKSIQSNFRDYSIYKNEKTNDNTVGLTQGDKFLNYQNKIKKQTQGSNKTRLFSNNKEGFSSDLKGDTDVTLSQTNFSSDDKSTLRNLKLEYAATMKIYQKLQAKFKEKTHQFFKRVDPAQNKFLGKNIRFRQGEQCYVTMQGVARYYNSADIDNATSGKNGCPALADFIYVDVPWKNEYASPGATIPTRPPLISGPPMTMEQACGNEGSNVYVNTSVSTKPKYVGAYVNNDSSGITYLGARPPKIIPVQNRNFDQPFLDNNTYMNYADSTSVPGWGFHAVLVNNSNVWGYPMPYPGGKQCACLDGTGMMNQTFANLDTGTYTLSFYVCGRPGYSGSNPISLQLNNVTFYTLDIGDNFKWTLVSINFYVSQGGANTITFAGQSTSGDRSTAITGVSLVFGAGDTDPPTFTYDMCKTQAITQGYQYFGLTHAEEDKGYCVVTKDYVAATGTGTSYKTVSLIPKWSSETNGKGGAYAKLTSLGTIQVYDSNNQSIYSTPAPSGPGSDSFWGCYQDAASTGAARSVPDFVQGGDTSINDCRGLANQSVYAVQYAINNNGDNGQCFINNSNPTDFLSSFNAGPATNCTKDSSGWTIGQGWSNAVYGTMPGFGCFIILQDNGALAIYRGQGGSDNQGIIWSAGSDSSSFTSNPHWKPSNGKYGTYWASNGFNGQTGSDDGFILYPGQCMFSNDGKLQLIMQSDGNLVLYTSTIAVNERTDSKGNKVSDQDGYALYEFEDTPNINYNGTVGYVDGAGTFHKYTDGAKMIDDSYTKYSSLQNPWYLYSINGEESSTKSVADCKKACTDDAGCGGITYDTQSGTCYYTESNDFLYDTYANEYYDTYLKNKKPANPIYTNQTNNISGALHDRYKIGEDMPNGVHFNLQEATAVISSELSHVEDKLNQLAAEISKYNAEFAEYNHKVLNQSKENKKGTDKYLNEYDATSKKIKRVEGSNMDAILDDSNIVVLQENYDYTLWSILAVGVGIASMILVKK